MHRCWKMQPYLQKDLREQEVEYLVHNVKFNRITGVYAKQHG